jgi:hypothetical protein
MLARGDIDAIAYTAGPGLAGALLVGASFAEALAMALGVPALPVHHLEGHLLSPLLAADAPAFPFVALLVSGGHTQLMHVARVGATNCSASRWTTPPARPSTRPPSCWAWATPAGRRSPSWPSPARRVASSCRGRCSTAAIWPSVFRA